MRKPFCHFTLTSSDYNSGDQLICNINYVVNRNYQTRQNYILYFSKDNILDTSDLKYYSTMTNGGNYNDTKSTFISTIPDIQSEEKYNLFVVSQIDNVNIDTVSTEILLKPCPINISIDSTSIPIKYFTHKKIFKIKHYTNNSATNSKTLILSYYLSIDSLLSENDYVVDNFSFTTTSLNIIKGSSVNEASLYIKSEIPIGTYYLITRYTINNIERTSQINISKDKVIVYDGMPVISNFQLLSSDTLIKGDTIRVDYDVNSENYANTNLYERFYLSKDKLINSNDYYVHSLNNNILMFGNTNKSYSFVYNSNAPAGEYYLIYEYSSSELQTYNYSYYKNIVSDQKFIIK